MSAKLALSRKRVACVMEMAVPRSARKTAAMSSMAVIACIAAAAKDRRTPRLSVTSLATI